MGRNDHLLKQSLNDLAPRVDEGGLWDSLQSRVAGERRERLRRCGLVIVAVIIVAALAFCAYEITQLWAR